MVEVAAPRRPMLLVTRNFPPLLGGMENVNLHIVRSLSQQYPVLLSGPEGCAAHAPEALAVAESPLRPLPVFVALAAWRGLRLACGHRPARVVAGSGLAAPMAWLAAKSSGAKSAVYLHGLDIIAPSGVYQMVWLPFIRRMDRVLVNSANTAALASAAGVPKDRIHVLHPGTEVPPLDPAAGEDFRREFGLGLRPLLLSVGRLTRRKGLAEFVERALPAIVACAPDVLLVVIGEEATNALHGHGGGERARIEAAADAAGVAAHLRFIGRRDDAGLSAAYQAAQVHVFPVVEQAGDVEGFGMVALESAAHGLRTVSFRLGGIPDAVCEPDSGRLVAPGDYTALAAAVVECLALPQDAAGRESAREFARGKDWSAFGARLRALLAD